MSFRRKAASQVLYRLQQAFEGPTSVIVNPRKLCFLAIKSCRMPIELWGYQASKGELVLAHICIKVHVQAPSQVGIRAVNAGISGCATAGKWKMALLSLQDSQTSCGCLSSLAK